MTDLSASPRTPKPPHGLPFFVAHTPPREYPDCWHPLADHLTSVARLAAEFAQPFGGSDWARYLGLLHDLGKFSDAFQMYLWKCHQGGKAESKPHKQAGAIIVNQALPGFGKFLAQPLYGHHGGMIAPAETLNEAEAKFTSEQVASLLGTARAVHPDLAPAPPDFAALCRTPHAKGTEAMEMFLRFLFSCLTDADALDTEAHMNPQEAARRTAGSANAPSLATLRETFLKRQETLMREANPTPVNAVRREVYDACLDAARSAPGVFTLTVPTGGGKTLSSLAFALEHAAYNGHEMKRIVYAIPFTSIVEQTAGVFYDLFGQDSGAVLEHHSAIESQRKGEEKDKAGGGQPALWRRLAAQNWDAPLIVTTTVQLFESLFSNRPGKCRKLHRLAKSVIVLDEVQTLPPQLLTPLVSGLRLLAENYGATIVLCTATQPALTGQSRFFQGFDPPPTPIIADPKKHFAALRRVRYRLAPQKDEPVWDWPCVAAEMRRPVNDRATEPISALCIANTRQQALDLIKALDPDSSETTPETQDKSVFHLSTLLCGRHRREVLNTVRERLEKKEPVLLSATQVVEAGVDVDFPRVLRALGPLDRIIQAAGRCNREGRRPVEESEVIVFTPANAVAPPGIYDTSLGLTARLLADIIHRGETPDFNDPAFVTGYFTRLYEDLQGELDAYGVQPLREKFHFDAVARKVRLIRDETVSALCVRYAEDEAEEILEEAHRLGRMTSELWRRAQPLCVSIFKSDAEKRLGMAEEFEDSGLYVWRGPYSARTGIPLTSDPADAVAHPPDDLIVR